MCAIKKIWTTCRSAPKPFGNVVTTLWFHISSSSLTSRGFLTVRRKPWFGGGERSGIWHEICHLALMRVDPLHLTSSTSRLFMSHLLLVLYFENISIMFYNGLYDIGINLNAYMILLGLYIYIYISYFQYLLFFTCTCFSTSFPKQTTGFFITLPRTAGVMPPALWSACWSWSGCPTAGAGRPGAMAKILLLKLNPPKKGKDTQHVTYCREINRNFPGISGNWPKTH